MAEYITKEQVIEWFRPYGHTAEGIPFPTLKSDVTDMPAADVAPVVHGKWEHIGIVKKIAPIYPRCSVCGIVSAAYRSQWEGLQGPWKYCPICGAMMDGEA